MSRVHRAACVRDKPETCGDAAQAMSRWRFTDIVEGAAPRRRAFHGCSGLRDDHHLKRSVIYARQFLNRPGATELQSNDRSSWMCAEKDRGVQTPLRNFTNTFPQCNMINQYNEAYATSRSLGCPNQLTKPQVTDIRAKNAGPPLGVRAVTTGRKAKFGQQFDPREKNVVLITLKPQ